MNERGTGSAQYHPRMMLALLVYCYANGIFGSRRIERATYRDRSVRGGELSSGTTRSAPAQQLRSGSGGVPAGTAAGEGTEAAACWDGERGRDEGGREREQAPASATTVRGRCASSCEARSRGCWIRRSTPTRTTCRTRRVCRRGATSCGPGPCVRGVVRRRVRLGAGGYERKVAARERRTGSRKGRHIKPPTEAPTGADQPDGRGQCADAQEPAP